MCARSAVASQKRCKWPRRRQSDGVGSPRRLSHRYSCRRPRCRSGLRSRLRTRRPLGYQGSRRDRIVRNRPKFRQKRRRRPPLIFFGRPKQASWSASWRARSCAEAAVRQRSRAPHSGVRAGVGTASGQCPARADELCRTGVPSFRTASGCWPNATSSRCSTGVASASRPSSSAVSVLGRAERVRGATIRTEGACAIRPASTASASAARTGVM